MKPPASNTEKEDKLSASSAERKFQVELGFELGEIRRLKGITQHELAEAAGFHSSYIGNVEKGRRNISVENLYRICFAMRVKVSRLVGAVEQRLKATASKKTRLNAEQEGKTAKKWLRASPKVKGLRMLALRTNLEGASKPKRKPRPRVDFDSAVAHFPETNFSIKPEDALLVERAIHLLSAKWTTAIFIELSQSPKRHFEILQGVPGVNTKPLSHILKSLQNAGLVKRQMFRESPPRVEYSLTEDGHRAVNLLESVKELAMKMKPIGLGKRHGHIDG